MRGWRAARGAVALAAVAAMAISCAEVIGVPSETKSIAEDFCKCAGDESMDDAWPGETCIAHVEGRLSTAEPEVLAAWLDTYTENDCGSCTNTAGRQACKSAAPICAAVGASCKNTAFCCTPPGEEVYCGDQFVCVSENNCTPPFAKCDPAAPNCCGQAGFKGGCFGDTPEESICLESCNPDDPVNCPGCCAFFGQPSSAGESRSLCVPDQDCGGVCDPSHGDDCAPGYVCHPAVSAVETSIYTIDECLLECDPDGPDTCITGTCCVRFKDLTTSTDVGRCITDGQGTGICNRRCDVVDAAGVPRNCPGPTTCEEFVLPVGPAGPFTLSLCRSPPTPP
jgi:hypothetical protein